ncbi:hypothetical protein H311_00402, partial [Anncaliia algerae PRA109]
MLEIKQSTEELKEKLIQLILNKQYLCIKCYSKCVWKSKKKYLLKCSWKGCSLLQNALNDTLFFNSKLEVSKLIDIIVFWVHGLSLKNISLLSHTSRQCIYRILK